MHCSYVALRVTEGMQGTSLVLEKGSWENNISDVGVVTRLLTIQALFQVKVVILGQDPYHGPGQAHGLSFSVRVGVPPPPSLLNMYKELESDMEGFERPEHGFLMGWARQGVLLLNACLTVQHKQPKSHADKVSVTRAKMGTC